jgi:acyl-CoA dehydrogenase
MDLQLSPQNLAFRDRIRAFLEENLTPETRRAASLTTGFIHDPQIGAAFHGALHRKGWSVPHWPVEYGGTGWTPVERYIFESECGRAGAPIYNGAGSHMVGPVIMHFGTDEQKRKYLPRIVAGEDCWAQGYSEPGSGSDLASLRTRAVRDGEHYVINGQKIWTTHAHWANRIFALVRTSTEGRRQEGISFLLMDMNLPGITVRPIIGNGGDHEFNEVFFDNVRAPVSGRVGEENKGWEVAKYLLEFERGGNPVAGRARALFARCVKLIGEKCPGDPDIAARLGELGTDLDAMEMLELSVLSASQTGANPGPISSLLKMRWSQIRQQLAELAMDALGVDALRWIGERPLYVTLHLPASEEEQLAVMPRYLNFRAYTILGGTTEIQTGILARAMLGL